MDFEARVNREELRRKDEADCMNWGHLKGSPAMLSFMIYLSDELRGFVLEGLLRNPDEIPEWFLRGIQQDHN